MAWNTRDWTTEEEDKHWEMTEEDTDDEFDDIALQRMGLDIPDFAREDRHTNTNTADGVGVNVSELIRQWQGVLENSDNPTVTAEIMESLESMVGRDGNIHFGDEPQGVDPVRAGFDFADDENVHEEERCGDCGALYEDCDCHERCIDCGYHYDECMCERCYGCELLYDDCVCDAEEEDTR